MEGATEKLEKRNRPPVSCEPCRQRKLKCNRGLPCDTCIRRNKQSICQYASNARRNKPSIPSKQAQLQEKLKNLESLVSSLATKQERPSSSPGAPTASPFGSLDLAPRSSPSSSTKESPRPIMAQDGQVNYVDASHWQSVLEELKEVREQLAFTGLSLPNEAAINPEAGMEPEISLLFSGAGAPDLGDILGALPRQVVCDGLLSTYFNAPVTLLPIIHPEKFRVEYQDFWANPGEVNLVWLGMLFSVLSMSVSLRMLAKGPDSSLPHPLFLQQRTAQCLVLGEYASANHYTLESLILYMQSCFLTNSNAQIQLWLKMGHCIQLAFRLGYNRDPSKLPGISVFDGEMRRRVWMNLIQLDALGSFQIGLPSMIPNDYCDTRVPGNYEYSDLHVDMTELPPPRPLTQRTPMTYTISKAHVMAVFKKITAHTQTLAETTYDRTVALDLEMREAYSKVPALLQRRDVSQSYMDPSSLIWDRANIELLYLKGIIVLHRRYLRHEPGNPRFEPSRRYCVEAALDMLARQSDIALASRPGGRLHEDRWMSGALAVYDFILAAMVVCLDLSVRTKPASSSSPTSTSKPGRSSTGNGNGNTAATDDPLAAKELAALQVSQGIWAATAAMSSEAAVAARTIELMLKSMERRREGTGTGMDQQQQQQSQQPPSYYPAPPPATGMNLHLPPPAHTHAQHAQPAAVFAAATGGSANAGSSAAPGQGPGQGHGQGQVQVQVPYAEPMFEMIDGSEPLDWSLLDQYFQGTTGVAATEGQESWDTVGAGAGGSGGGGGTSYFDDLHLN